MRESSEREQPPSGSRGVELHDRVARQRAPHQLAHDVLERDVQLFVAQPDFLGEARNIDRPVYRDLAVKGDVELVVKGGCEIGFHDRIPSLPSIECSPPRSWNQEARTKNII